MDMDSTVSLKDKIISKMAENWNRPTHLKEIAKEFIWIPESTIRGRFNENTWSLFERLWKGFYILKWEKWTIWLINWDARTLDNKFEPSSIDLILSDHAWLDEKSHTWWTRSFANYDCFKYEQHDFEQKFKVLKDGWFLIEFLPEKNENNKKYLRDIEDMAEKSWFRYFAEVNISWWNSNIWRKKKFISACYFFTKWDAVKLKIYDEKLAKDIKEWKFSHLKDEYRIDFKKVYSEVLHVIKQAEIPELYYNKMSEALKNLWLTVWNKIYDDEYKKTLSKDALMERTERLHQDYLDSGGNYEPSEWEFRCKELNSNEYNKVVSETDSKIIGYLFKQWFDQNSFTTIANENWSDIISFIKGILDEMNNEHDVLIENFRKHLSIWELPQFKKMKKKSERIEELYYEKTHSGLNEEKQVEYDNLRLEETSFYKAFSEYTEFLKKADSYKMWTKTILPEFYIWDTWNLREESQKPKNVIEDIVLQTSNEWASVLEQYARSFVWAEAIISIWEDWKWWRNYFWIELDKEVFDRSLEYLKNKYKDFKFYTYDDFYSELPPEIITTINQSTINKNFKLIESSILKINEDLWEIINLRLSGLKVRDDSLQVTPNNVDMEDWAEIMVFNMKRNLSQDNKLLRLVLNKKNNMFEVINGSWTRVNQIDNLNEWLVKMYNTFREKVS